MIRTVSLSADAKKDLKTCPTHIVRKFMAWVGSVQTVGLEETRKSPGWHDEPLKGKWTGHRSVRLNIAYRALYRISKDGSLELVLVETVNKQQVLTMPPKKVPAKAKQLNASTNAFLQSLNAGPLTFAQLLSSIRESDQQSLAQFAARLDISRQHLHQLESGSKRVSPERAMRFAQILGYNELYFVQLALQDIVDDIGIHAKVEVNVA